MSRLLIAAVISLASVGAAKAANLFVNSSFETPGTPYATLPGGSAAVAGWTTVLSGVEYYNAAAYATGPAPDGSMVVDLANYTYLAGGGIEQTVATVAGQAYDVSFWAGNSAYAGRDGTGIVRISIDGTWLQDIATAQGASRISTWAQRTFSFTAADTSTTVRFWNDQNPYLHFALIDGVSIEAASPPTGQVPEPHGWALLLAGLGAMVAVRRQRG